MTDPLVYIAPCGMGLGHAYRMLSVAKKIKNAGVNVVFSTYSDAVELIKKEGFNVLETREVTYVHDSDGSISIRMTLAKGLTNIYNFSRQIGDEIYRIQALDPDIVLSDSRLSTIIASKMLGKTVFLILNQLRIIMPSKEGRIKVTLGSIAEEALSETLKWLWTRADKIFIPDFPQPYTISAWSIDETLNIEYVGPFIPRWPEEYPSKDEILSELGLANKKIILATFTGLKNEREMLYNLFLKVIEKCYFRDDVFFIISKGNIRGNSIVAGKRYMIFDWIEDKYLYLKAADIVVTHGGHTSVVEAIVYGVPSLHIVSKNHTERLKNAESAAKLGVARYVTSEDISEICHELWELLTNPIYRENVSSISKEISWLRGDINLAKSVLSYINKSSRYLK